MIIDFNKIEELAFPGMNGGTGLMTVRMYNDEKYRIIPATIHSGGSIGMHRQTFGADDFRSKVPRFEQENIAKNMVLVDFVNEIAQRKQCTPAQVALSWVMAQKPWIVAIPGSTSWGHLTENFAAADTTYTDEEMREINRRLSEITLSGHRYNADSQKNIDSGY